ncbi:MAG: tetratricopeptide repeat protein [Candidatus Cyclobacteriaceae bacterium M3_2C_046]
MAKIIKLPHSIPGKFGYKKAKRKRKPNLEDYGQLNLFAQPPAEARVISMKAGLEPFEEALLVDENEDERARELYLKAIQSEDHVADAYCNLGIIESRQGNIAKAIDSFTQCLKYEPRHFEAHYNLGNIYSDAANYNLARLHYQISIEIEPGYPNSYFNLGLVLAMMNNYMEAIDVLTKYKELAPFEEKHNASELLKSLAEFC